MGTTSPSCQVSASHADLLDGQFATLATVGPDGRPQVSEVWFLRERDSVAISLNTSRQKAKNLAVRPACSVVLLDVTNPYRYVEIRGDAVLEDDDDYSFADRVGAKYGTDLRVHDQPGEARVVVRLHPVRVHAVNMGG